jgi:hypothetical protein
MVFLEGAQIVDRPDRIDDEPFGSIPLTFDKEEEGGDEEEWDEDDDWDDDDDDDDDDEDEDDELDDPEEEEWE